MYLMDKTQFLTMPPETIFSRFYPELMQQPYDAHAMPPVAFGELCIKGETRDGDFEFTELVEDCAALDDSFGSIGRSLMMGIATINHYRKKLQAFASDRFSAQQDIELAAPEELPEELYAIWEDHDVRNLVTRLNRASDELPQPTLLATVDELAAKWVFVEDSAATS